jgi:hypothetical protein
VTPYSLVEHLAKATWFSNWREAYLVGFSGYFDASGDDTCKDTIVVSVAGFMASADIWMDVESEWTDRTARAGIKKFHMVECANCTEEFKGWHDKEKERQKLLRDLIDLMKPLTRKFSCAVPLKIYRKTLSSEYANDPLYKAYALAGRWCAGRLRQWVWQEKSPPLHRIGFYYERGDKWQEELKQQMVGDDLPEPNFKPKWDVCKNGEVIEKGLVPFQLADTLAYLTFLHYKYELKQMKDWGKMESIRWMLAEIESRVRGPLDYVTTQNIKGLNVLARASSHDLLKG